MPPGPQPGLCGAQICPAVSVLLAACQPAGECSIAAEGIGTRACYDNGVRVIATPNPAAVGVRIVVTRPDEEAPCYKIDLGLFLEGGARVAIFRDAAGTILSQGVLLPNGRLALTCEAGDVELAPECTPITRTGVCRPGSCR